MSVTLVPTTGAFIPADRVTKHSGRFVEETPGFRDEITTETVRIRERVPVSTTSSVPVREEFDVMTTHHQLVPVTTPFGVQYVNQPVAGRQRVARVVNRPVSTVGSVDRVRDVPVQVRRRVPGTIRRVREGPVTVRRTTATAPTLVASAPVVAAPRVVAVPAIPASPVSATPTSPTQIFIQQPPAPQYPAPQYPAPQYPAPQPTTVVVQAPFSAPVQQSVVAPFVNPTPVPGRASLPAQPLSQPLTQPLTQLTTETITITEEEKVEVPNCSRCTGRSNCRCHCCRRSEAVNIAVDGRSVAQVRGSGLRVAPQKKSTTYVRVI